MSIKMTAKHAQWPKEKDVIFEIAGRAKDAIKEYGKENVIDATIGALVDDDGNLVCLDTVYDELKSLPNAKIAAYADLAGLPEFLESVEKVCFQDYRPDAYIKTVATPGGSGSIKHAVWGYTNPGDEILVSDWFWATYSTMAVDVGRKLTHYELFNEKGEFNIESFKANFERLVLKQKRVLTIINTPAHNPTGYSLSDEEWDKVLEIMSNATKNKDNKIILFVDTAYIDFAGDKNERRAFFKKFEKLPENLFVIVGFSLSKGYTMYGLRCGAAIGISSDEEVAEDFYYACIHGGRASWSNCNRSAMQVLINITKDEQKQEVYLKEKDKYKDILKKRAKAFTEEAEKAKLDILPYKDGFFISIPHNDSKAVVEKLTESNIFAVPLKMGVRFAVCSVSEEKCKKAPALIKDVIELLK